MALLDFVITCPLQKCVCIGIMQRNDEPEGNGMRVLDIDLDFFLMDCCPLAEKGERPALMGCEPWEEERVVAFLEEQCGLQRDAPVPGRVFETHDQALTFWEEQIGQGRLNAPFHVTHVDAHSDLGIGYPGPNYVLFNMLAMKMEKRLDVQQFYDQHKLDEANYLLFALAMRRIASLDNVRNPKSRPDIPTCLLDENGNVQLDSMTARMFRTQNGEEPTVPFHVYEDYRAFRAEGKYDFVTLAISPRYAPKEADALVEVVQRYIRPV